MAAACVRRAIGKGRRSVGQQARHVDSCGACCRQARRAGCLFLAGRPAACSLQEGQQPVPCRKGGSAPWLGRAVLGASGKALWVRQQPSLDRQCAVRKLQLHKRALTVAGPRRASWTSKPSLKSK